MFDDVPPRRAFAVNSVCQPDASAIHELDELQQLYSGLSDPEQRRRALALLRSVVSPAPLTVEAIVPVARKIKLESARERIMLVDDDSDILVSIGGWLEAENMDVVRANSGEEALNRLEGLGVGESIDAVVSDVMMPGMSGVDYVAAVRRLWPTMPALVITGYAEFAGANDLPADVPVLRKPFRRKEFVSRVKEMLAVREARR